MAAPPIAEAFVRIRPDMGAFRSELNAGLNQQLGRFNLGGLSQQQKEAATGANALAGAQIAYNDALRQGGVLLEKNAASEKAASAARTSSLASLRSAVDSSNALRGALIGISRVTPVAVFGLGLYGTAAIAAGLALRASIANAAQFEQQLNIFRATAQATGEQLDDVATEARKLGRDVRLPSTSSTDAAVAMTELAKAGLSVEDSIAGARGVLELAAAASIDAASAAQIAASALNAFALSGEEATHVADLLAAASVAAQGDITDMANALAQSSAVAHQLGITADDTVAAITELAKSGLLGSDAGTSLRTTLLRLTPTTKEALQFQKALGVETTDTAGNLKDLGDIVESYRQSLEGLSDVQQQLFLQQIFGQDAIRAASILIRGGAQGFEDARLEVERNNAAQELAAARAEGLAGAWDGLKSNAETLATSFGSLLSPALEVIIRGFSDALAWVNSLFEALEKLKSIGDIDIPIKFHISGLPSLPGTPGGGGIPGLPPLPDIDVPDLPTIEVDVPLLGKVRVDLQHIASSAGLVDEKSRAAAKGVNELADAFVVAIAPGDRLNTLLLSLGSREVAPGTGGFAFARREWLEDAAAAAALGVQVEVLAKRINNLLEQGATPGDSAVQALVEQLEIAIQKSIDIGDIGIAQLQRKGVGAAKIFADSVRSAIAEIVPGVQSTLDLVPNALEQQIETLALLPGGKASLRALGVEITSTIADGMESSDAMIEAAQQQLDDAIRQRDEAVKDAIRQARGNLRTLADQVADQVGQIFDATPFAVPEQKAIIRIGLQTDVREAERALRQAQTQGLKGDALQPFIANVHDAREALRLFARSGKASIETLEGVLDDLQRRLERRNLAFQLRQAQRELRDAQIEVATASRLGTQTAGQRQAVEEFLDPFREDVAQAKGEIQTFDLQGQITQMEEVRDAAKKAATEGIDKLVASFDAGKTSAEKFETVLRSKLKTAIDNLPKTNLGLTFTNDFLDTVDSLVRQAQLLTGFLNVAGTTPGTKPTSPADVKRTQDQQVARARENLEKSLENSRKTEENTRQQVALLGFILAVLRDRTPKTPPTQREITAGIAAAKTLVGLDSN